MTFDFTQKVIQVFRHQPSRGKDDVRGEGEVGRGRGGGRGVRGVGETATDFGEN